MTDYDEPRTQPRDAQPDAVAKSSDELSGEDEFGEEGAGYGERELKCAEEFSLLAEELLGRREQAPTLEQIVTLAVQTIEACDYCGVSVRERGGRVATPAASDPLVDELDELQYHSGEGPCLDAIWTLDTYLVTDTARDTRWPRWEPQARERGICSVLSLRLAHGEQTLGSLNLYATAPAAFDHTDVAMASIFARHAAAAFSVAQDYDGLTAALLSRQIIGAAQGTLIQRYGLTLDQAFEVLLRYSKNHNVKVRDVARILVQSGGIPHHGSIQALDKMLTGVTQEHRTTG